MAQRTAAQFKSTKNTRFADNTAGDISAGDSRDMYEDVADSFLNISDHLLDEDAMTSNSATKVPSQQSVKAYVDNEIAGLGTSDIQYTSVTLSAAQVLNSNSSPVELIAAPGAGKVIMIVGDIYAFLDFGTTQYATNTNLRVRYGTTNIGVNLGISSGADTTYVNPVGSSSAIGVNQNVNVHAPVGNPTDGDSPITFYIHYKLLTVF